MFNTNELKPTMLSKVEGIGIWIPARKPVEPWLMIGTGEKGVMIALGADGSFKAYERSACSDMFGVYVDSIAVKTDLKTLRPASSVEHYGAMRIGPIGAEILCETPMDDPKWIKITSPDPLGSPSSTVKGMPYFDTWELGTKFLVNEWVWVRRTNQGLTYPELSDETEI